MPSPTPPSASSAPRKSKAAEPAGQGIPRSRYVTFFSIAVGGCALDLLSKQWVFAVLGNRHVMPYAKESVWIWQAGLQFGFETNVNEGALFGLGQGQQMWFALLSVIAAIGVFCWLFWAKAAKDLLLTIALGLVTGGIFGNLYDRLGLPALRWQAQNVQGHEAGEPVYAVRDWLHFKIDIWNFDWPIFNIADTLLVVGAFLLFAHAIFFHKPEKKKDPKKKAKA